jgi:hypothetical protein
VKGQEDAVGYINQLPGDILIIKVQPQYRRNEGGEGRDIREAGSEGDPLPKQTRNATGIDIGCALSALLQLGRLGCSSSRLGAGDLVRGS